MKFKCWWNTEALLVNNLVAKRYALLMFRCLTVGLFVLFSGCWARLPSRGPESLRALVGKTATLQKPLYIYGDPGDLASLTEKETAYADHSKQIAILYPGDYVKVVSIVSRRLPAGVAYYLVLQSTVMGGRDIRFDYLCGLAPIPQPYADSILKWK